MVYFCGMAFGTSVDVKVGAFIRGWVIALTGSDFVKLDKYTNLWAIVKQNLELRPSDYTIIQDRSEYISIELLDSTGTLCYNIPSQREVYIDTLFRMYISPAGQAAIQRYLENQLRSAFRTYMVARTSDGKKEPIRHSIGSFLADFKFPVDNILIERFAKDWYRYRQKFCENYQIPIFF